MKTAKAWVAAVGTVVTALSAAFADDILDHSEIGGLVSTVVLGALAVWSVYQVPNAKTTPPAGSRLHERDPELF